MTWRAVVGGLFGGLFGIGLSQWLSAAYEGRDATVWIWLSALSLLVVAGIVGIIRLEIRAIRRRGNPL